MTANPTSDRRRWVCLHDGTMFEHLRCTAPNVAHPECMDYNAAHYVDPAPVTPDAEPPAPPSVGTGSATRPDTAALRDLPLSNRVNAAADWIDAQPDLSELSDGPEFARLRQAVAALDRAIADPTIPQYGDFLNMVAGGARAALAAVDRLLATEGGQA